MAQTLLREGFTLKTLCETMTYMDEEGKMHEPILCDENGAIFSSAKEAQEALNQGQGIFVREVHPGTNGKVVYCAKNEKGTLSISDPLTINFDKALEAKVAETKKPSFGRILAYKLLGWIGPIKKMLADVEKYEANKLPDDYSIDQLKDSWKKHVKEDTIPNFEASDGQDGIFNESLQIKSDIAREKEPYVPCESPIDPHFMDGEIMLNRSSAEWALKTHARERAESCLTAVAMADQPGTLKEEYPGIDDSKLTPNQKAILKEGLVVRAKMFNALATQKKTDKLDISKEDMAILAEAQLVHKLIVETQNPEMVGGEKAKSSKAMLDLLEIPSNEMQFQKELAAQFETDETEEFIVEDAFTFLETKDGAAIFGNAIVNALPLVQFVAAEAASENIAATPTAQMGKPAVQKIAPAGPTLQPREPVIRPKTPAMQPFDPSQLPKAPADTNGPTV